MLQEAVVQAPNTLVAILAAAWTCLIALFGSKVRTTREKMDELQAEAIDEDELRGTTSYKMRRSLEAGP